MKESLNKYFAGELTSDEKESFLMEVDKDKVLKENFVDNQSLLVIIDWTFPGNKDNEEVIQQKLDEFMRKMEQRERYLVLEYHESILYHITSSFLL